MDRKVPDREIANRYDRLYLLPVSRWDSTNGRLGKARFIRCRVHCFSWGPIYHTLLLSFCL